MYGLLILLCMIVWLILCVVVARIFAHTFKPYSKTKKLLYCTFFFLLFIAPASEAIYVATTFSMYCGRYAGLTKFNPIVATSFESDRSKRTFTSEYDLLLLTSIQHVHLLADFEGSYKPDYWLSRVRKASDEKCEDPYLDWARANKKPIALGAQKFSEALEASGFCLSTEPYLGAPQVMEVMEVIQPLVPEWPFMAAEMRATKYQIRDYQSQEVLSEYTVLYSDPGRTMRTINPYFADYSCFPGFGDLLDSAEPEATSYYTNLRKFLMLALPSQSPSAKPSS